MSEKQKWKLVRDSFSKLVIWFKDGNTRTFYSIDWKHQYSQQRDYRIGLARLRNKIIEWGNKAGVAIIYDTASGKRIVAFFEGKETQPKDNK